MHSINRAEFSSVRSFENQDNYVNTFSFQGGGEPRAPLYASSLKKRLSEN